MKTPNQLVFSAYHSRLVDLKNQLDPFLSACNGVSEAHRRKPEEIMEEIRQIAQMILEERNLIGTAAAAEAGPQGKIVVSLQEGPGLPKSYLFSRLGQTELRWIPGKGFDFSYDKQLLQ